MVLTYALYKHTLTPSIYMIDTSFYPFALFGLSMHANVSVFTLLL